MSEIIPLFSKPLYISTIEYDYQKYLKKMQHEFVDSGAGGRSNISQTSKNQRVLNLNNDLKYLVDKKIKEYLHECLKYENKFEICSSWLTKTGPGQSSNYHNHQNCFFSGVLYLQTNENSGQLSFEDFNTSRWKCNRSEFSIYNSPEVRFKPKPGMILIFPAEVHHAILPNESNEDRYSIAFNIIPVEGFGDGDSRINITLNDTSA